jgi:hypothetical protein
MPFTPAQFVRGMDYTIRTFDKAEPVDQINVEHPFLAWLMANKKDSLYGNGLFGNSVFMANQSNYQRYWGADQVTYNERDPARWAYFPYVNAHDGFWFDEDRLKANNIVIGEDGLEAPTKYEKGQLIDLLMQSWRALREGMQENLAYDTLLNGTQSTKAVVGLDGIVSTTPTVGTTGDLARSNLWWRNNIALGVAQSVLIDTMEITYRACLRYGKVKPTKIFVGAAFLDDPDNAIGVLGDISVGGAQVPTGAVMNMMGTLFQRAGQPESGSAEDESIPSYLLDQSGQLRFDAADPDARADALSEWFQASTPPANFGTPHATQANGPWSHAQEQAGWGDGLDELESIDESDEDAFHEDAYAEDFMDDDEGVLLTTSSRDLEPAGW